MTAGRPGARTARQLFVDAIEEGRVRLLDGDQPLSLPLALLPPGVREGDWIELATAVIAPPPDDTESRRKRLAGDDPGGDIDL